MASLPHTSIYGGANAKLPHTSAHGPDVVLAQGSSPGMGPLIALSMKAFQGLKAYNGLIAFGG